MRITLDFPDSEYEPVLVKKKKAAYVQHSGKWVFNFAGLELVANSKEEIAEKLVEHIRKTSRGIEVKAVRDDEEHVIVCYGYKGDRESCAVHFRAKERGPMSEGGLSFGPRTVEDESQSWLLGVSDLDGTAPDYLTEENKKEFYSRKKWQESYKAHLNEALASGMDENQARSEAHRKACGY